MRDSKGMFIKGLVPHNKKPVLMIQCVGCQNKFQRNYSNPATRYCSRKCVVNSLRGKKKSPEHIAKIKQNHAKYWTGKQMTPEHITKMIVGLKDYQSGPKHWNWKGGVTPTLKKLRFTSEYRKWRTLVYERDNYTCQFCGVRGGVLNADHIIPFAQIVEREGWVLLYDINNGRTLCEDCHKTTPTYGGRRKAWDEEFATVSNKNKSTSAN